MAFSIRQLPFSALPFAKTDLAYIQADEALSDFYDYPPTEESFAKAASKKQISATQRQLIVQELMQQYASIDTSADVLKNIESLLSPNTFTIITAHQPTLFAGPLYCIYKIISTINLAEHLNRIQNKNRYIPVYVMGSEDHDVAELNHISIYGKNIVWQTKQQGAIGKFSTNDDTLQQALNTLKEIVGTSPTAQEIYNKIEKAYNTAATFAEATQKMYDALFANKGLIVADTNNDVFKQLFKNILQDEVLNFTSHRIVNQTITQLQQAGFKAQATPRQINLFYLQNQFRERIVFEDNMYKVLNSDLTFTAKTISEQIDKHPEKFSCNVVLRPLYQESIFPNVAYIGGGGELAYWLERKAQFEHYDVRFPILIRRNSAQFIDASQVHKLQQFGFSWTELFADNDTLTKQLLAQISQDEFNLTDEKNAIEKIYATISDKLKSVDNSLIGVAKADEVKILKMVNGIETRLVKAAKQRNEVQINGLLKLKDKILPNGGLQERHDNFLQYYIKYGDDFFEAMFQNFNPLLPYFLTFEETIVKK